MIFSKLMKLKVWTILILLSLVLMIPSLALGESIQIKEESINPGAFQYPLKRAWEKMRLFFTFGSENKLNFQQVLLGKRLSELKFVVDKKDLSVLETTSQRFSYQAGTVVEQLKKSGKDEKKAEVLEDFAKYQPVLENLRDQYPANSSFWMLLQHSINTLKILSDQLK